MRTATLFYMKYSGIIFIDDPRAEKLNVTPQTFNDFFAWDCRPKYIGIIRLRPKDHQRLLNFFDAGQQIYSEIRICAPNQETIDVSKDYGYELKQDPAGTPYLTDATIKIKKQELIKKGYQ